MIKRIGILLFILVWSVSSIAISSDEQIQDYILYPYQTGFSLQEEFFSGTTTSGTVGLLGMGVGSGTTSQQTSEPNRPGIVRRDTSAVINTITVTQLYPHSSAVFASNLPHNIIWIARLNTNDAETSVRLGSGNSVIGDPPGTGIYFEKDDADTNWFCVTESGGRTRTDSGVAVNTNFNVFEYRRLSASVEFYLNGVLVCTNTATLPTALVNPFTQIINSAAASKTMDMDYFEVNVQGMTR